MALAFETNNKIKHEQKKGVTQLAMGFIKKNLRSNFRIPVQSTL